MFIRLVSKSMSKHTLDEISPSPRTESSLIRPKIPRVSKQLGPVMWNIINACGVNEPERRQIIQILSQDEHAMPQALLIVPRFQKSPRPRYMNNTEYLMMIIMITEAGHFKPKSLTRIGAKGALRYLAAIKARGHWWEWLERR
ncbi:hypothetical protein KQX54_015740 [Cotesia glomerata]|uniref:Uncharacterized protein n=1 Tax=Cotesia glomerata TaxID=32391 RepID=A0AAV7IK40_COTGL|nr:hypothetical protein KQX54_015740 [Cotesia glomerata]